MPPCIFFARHAMHAEALRKTMLLTWHVVRWWAPRYTLNTSSDE